MKAGHSLFEQTQEEEPAIYNKGKNNLTILDWNSPFVTEFIELQKEDLIKCWNIKDARQPYIATGKDLEYFRMLIGDKVKIKEYRNKRKILQGFWLIKSEGEPECWVSKHLETRQYRRAFHVFLWEMYGMDRGARLGSDVVVEHVLSATRAIQNFDGLYYLRVTAAHTTVNSTFGSQWEAHRQKNERTSMKRNYTAEDGFDFVENLPAGGQKTIKKVQQLMQISWPLATKAFNIAAPKGKITDKYIITTIREMIKAGLYDPDDGHYQYGLTRQNFMRGQKEISDDEGGKRVMTQFVVPGTGEILTHENTLYEWLRKYPEPSLVQT